MPTPLVSPLALGTVTEYGTIEAVGWVGERYYWCVRPDGSVSMIPANVIEGRHDDAE